MSVPAIAKKPQPALTAKPAKTAAPSTTAGPKVAVKVDGYDGTTQGRHHIAPAPKAAPPPKEPLTPTTIDAHLAELSRKEKLRILVMAYGDVGVPPDTGAIIVNQTHLTKSGAPALKRAIATSEAKSGAPVLVAADQEGGNINRLRHISAVRFPSAAAMKRMELKDIRAEGKKTGEAMAAAGVNTLLGPDLDVARDGTLMDRMQRSFGTTPEEVTTRVTAFVAGLREGNPKLVILGKHFPGYDVRGNSDIARVSDPAPEEVVYGRAEPFFDVPGLDGVMVSSIRYTEIEDVPACFSAKIVAKAREKDKGRVVVTDDLVALSLHSSEIAAYKEYLLARTRGDTTQMEKLVAKHPGLASDTERGKLQRRADAEAVANAIAAFTAGCDILLVLDARVAPLMVQGLDAHLAAHPELDAQLDTSVRRVLALQARQSG
ncbi:MAG: glycoside hydrolase family 3 protein [Deltaproteobacteria bacterium]|nr:glycoside hydrolase family 3 protein [Deltaproteobacteria bacterium]